MANEKRLIDLEKARKDVMEILAGKVNTVVAVKVGVAMQEATVDAVEVVHGRWEDGICSNCKKEALSTSWDEPIYDYDWEENLRYSYTETHTEHILTDYCPNCGAKMDGGNEDD